MRSRGLIKAIRIAGSQAKLAERMKPLDESISQQHISYWLTHGIPMRRARQVAQVINGVDLADFFLPGEEPSSVAA